LQHSLQCNNYSMASRAAVALLLAAALTSGAAARRGSRGGAAPRLDARRGYAPLAYNASRGTLAAGASGTGLAAAGAPRQLDMENQGLWWTLWLVDGPVMTDPRVVIIYYGSGWRSNSAGIATINAFVQDLSGSPWWLINRDYTSGSDRVGRNVILEDYTIDDVSPWSNVDGHENDIILDSFQSGRLSVSCKNCNRVALIIGDESTTNDGHCTEHCGWHSHNKYSGHGYKWHASWVGNPKKCFDSLGSYSCSGDLTPAPNGDQWVDAMVSTVAHEIAEWATDPDGNSWYDDDDGAENADKCNWDMRNSWTNCNGAKVNMQLGSRQYLVQSNWVLGTGCRMAVTPTPAPASCTPSRTRAPSPTRTPTRTPTRSRTPSNTPTRSNTPSNTRTASNTATATGSGTATHSIGASASTTATATWSATNTPTATTSCFFSPSPWPRVFDRLTPIDPRAWLLMDRPFPEPEPFVPPTFDFRSVLPQGLPEFAGGGAATAGAFFARVSQGPLLASVPDATNQLAHVAPPADLPLYGGSLAQASPDGDDVTLIATSLVDGAVFYSFVTLSYDSTVDVQTPGLADTRVLNDRAAAGDAQGPAARRAQGLNRPRQAWGKGADDVPPVAAAHLGDGRSFLMTARDGSLSLVQRAGGYWGAYNVARVAPPPPGGLAGLATLQVGFAALLPCGPGSLAEGSPACVNGPTSIVFARGGRLMAQEGVVESARACGRVGHCAWPAHLKSPALPSPRVLLTAAGNITAFSLLPTGGQTASPGAFDIVVASSIPAADLPALPVLDVFRADPASGTFVRLTAPLLFGGAQGGRVSLLELAASAPVHAGTNLAAATGVGSLLVASSLGPCYRPRIAMLLVDFVPAGGARRLQAGEGAWWLAGGGPVVHTPSGGFTVVGTRLALFDPNAPEGSPLRLRVLGDPSGPAGANAPRPAAALLEWPRFPPKLLTPSASATPRLPDGSAPPSATQSLTPFTPPPSRSGTPVLTRVPSPSATLRPAWGARGDVVIVLRAFAPSGAAVGASANTAALAVDAFVSDAAGGRPVGTSVGSVTLSYEHLCTLPGNAPVGGLGALWGPNASNTYELPLACLGVLPGMSPHLAGRHTLMVARGRGNVGESAWLRRPRLSPAAIPTGGALPLPHFTSVARAPSGGGGWASNASGVFALSSYVGDGVWTGEPRACAICGAGGRLCAGGVAQVLPRYLGYASPAAPGSLFLFATTPTSVLYAPVPNAADLACGGAGGVLAGVVGTALRGLTFATDNELFVADGARGLLGFRATAAAPISPAIVSAKWASSVVSAPQVGVGLLGVLFRSTPVAGGVVFATTAATGQLYSYALRTGTWVLVADAPKGQRFLGVFDPPTGAGLNAASQTAAPTVSPTPSRSTSRSATRKRK